MFGPCIYKMLTKDEFLMTLMKLRLDFLFTDLSQHFGIYLVTFALKFFIHGHGSEIIKIICDVKSKVICLHNRYGNNINNRTQNIELEISKTY